MLSVFLLCKATVLKRTLNITEDFTYKDIERAYENPNVILVPRMLFDKTNEPAKGKETRFAGDGTDRPAAIHWTFCSSQ